MDDWKREAHKMMGDRYGKAIVYTGGTFDLLHSGHINIFKKAKQIGNHLIVAVSTNELVRSYKGIDPILNYKERSTIVRSIKYVDRVVKQTKIFDVEQFRDLGADVFIIGDDWKGKKNKPLGLKWLIEHDKVLFVPYTKRLSTTEIKRKIIKQAYEIIRADVERNISQD